MKATLRSDALSATIGSRGAEITSVRDASGHEWIWPGRQPWLRSAPLLFPVIGASAGGCVHWRGRDYPIPMHGFAPDSEFTLVRQENERCAFLLSSSERTLAMYPLAFELRVGFDLKGSTLEQTVSVTNPTAETIAIQVGLHPGFTLPAGGSEAPIAVFEKQENPMMRRLRGGYACELAPSPAQGRAIAIRPSTFEDGGMLFEDVQSGWLWHGRPGDIGVKVSFKGFPHVALWSKGEAEFLCIEPWQGVPDSENFTGALTEKGSGATIPPGGTLTRRCRIEFGMPEPSL